MAGDILSLLPQSTRSPAAAGPDLDPLELLAAEAYGDVAVTEIIRPAAILPEEAARQVLVELAHRDARAGGLWISTPSTWERFDVPWADACAPGPSRLIGSMQVSYGVPTRYDITVYRATITSCGQQQGWTVESLCDEALGYGGYTLAECPRAELVAPPKPFRMGA
jgi:hypothetical protein